KMRLLGATVTPVESGSKTLKDATNEAIRDWVTNVRTTHYVIGSAVGPHPYPLMVREFQSVIGREARAQMLAETGRLPSVVVACVGGGSNAIGIFAPFYEDPVRLIGVEAAGRGLTSGAHAASILAGRPGVLHGSFSYLLQDDDGQVLATHSISAGLDYPGVGPEHAFLHDVHRAEYVRVTDEQALIAFLDTSRTGRGGSRGRRRRGRAGHSLLGSAGRRSDHPGGLAARAQGRYDRCRRPRVCAGRSVVDPGASAVHDLSQSHPGLWPRPLLPGG